MSEKYSMFFTCDDIGQGDAQHVLWFRELVEYLERKGIKATFFWVPLGDGIPANQSTEWMNAVEWAMSLGHDIQWHGLRHHCLEFGLPQEGLRRENTAAFKEYDSNRRYWETEHAIPRIREKMEMGIELYRKAFACEPLIFRSPCLGVSDAMYACLHELGVMYSSSRVINPKSWVYSVHYDQRDRVWETEISPYPYRVGEVTEIPLMSDYSHWGIPQEKYHDLLDLAKRDYDHLIAESRGTGVMLSHYHSMHRNWKTCLRFYDELLDYLVAKHGVTFVTLKEICRKELL